MSSLNNTGHERGVIPEEQILLSETRYKNGSIITSPKYSVNRTGKQTPEGKNSSTVSIVEPVKLTPAWEDRNLPNDELNFKDVTMEQAQLETNPPKDRYRLVYFILLLHGIGTLMPWNMFINAKSYFVDYKLGENCTDGSDLSEYRTNFLPYIGVASQTPNFIFNWFNIFVQIGGTLTSRIVWSILVEVAIFLVTVVLAMVNSCSWSTLFFWVTIFTVFILNTANGIYQNTVYGLAAKLPPQYTGAVILGSNVSGTFTAVISMLTGFLAPSSRTAAVYYFVTALLVLLACFDTYFALPLSQFYKYHELQYQKAESRSNATRRGAVPYWSIFKQCFPQCFNVFFLFFVTLCVFPAIHSDVKKSSNDFIVPDKFYVDITCFLTFNFCAMLGNLLSTGVTVPGPDKLVWPILLRLLFIPAFLLCNYQPRDIVRVMPVLINSDWAYWAIAFLFAFSSGYFSSLAMMYCPRAVETQYSVIAGMFGAASLVTGVCAGIIFSTIFPWIVANIGW